MSTSLPEVRWERMTAPELSEVASAVGGVCLLPLGCLERHGTHLPLGTDSLIAHRTCVEAARIEPAVVFPVQDIMGVVNEVKHHPGSIALPAALQIQLWEVVCDEISRNGFHKIILLSGHGGNRFMIPQFIFECMDRRKDYVLYWPRRIEEPAFRASLMESEYEAHAGEMETSLMLHLCPDDCRPERIGELDGTPQKDLDLGGESYTSGDWFITHPEQYAGDAKAASPEKGRRLLEHRAGQLARVIANVKADTKVAAAMSAYYDRCESFRHPPAPSRAQDSGAVG